MRWNIDVSHCGFNSSWVRDGQSKWHNVKVQKVNIKLVHIISPLIITMCHLKSGFTSSCSLRCRIRWVWTFSPNKMKNTHQRNPVRSTSKTSCSKFLGGMTPYPLSIQGSSDIPAPDGNTSSSLHSLARSFGWHPWCKWRNDTQK